MAKVADILRHTARTLLLVFGILIFIFALVSGAATFGPGIKGVVLNSPNALPWLILLILVYVAWNNELVGGILIALLGILTVFFFNTLKHAAVFFIISLPLVVLGGFFVLSWYLRNHRN